MVLGGFRLFHVLVTTFKAHQCGHIEDQAGDHLYNQPKSGSKPTRD